MIQMATLPKKSPTAAANLSPKARLRLECKAKRAAIPQARRYEAAAALAETLAPLLAPYSKVLSFTSFGTEIDTLPLNTILQQRGQLILPEESPLEASIVLVPGLAFDSRCHRLGYGKGWYDRLLAQLEIPAFGIGFSEQKMEILPTQPHDIPLSGLYLF